MDEILWNDWHPVCYSDELGEGGTYSIVVLEQQVVLWRWEGKVRAWRDLCLHRGTRLSLGTVREGKLVCAYHGWRYDGSGRCVHIPAHPDQPPPSKACVETYHCREVHGLIWVCLGEPNEEPLDFAQWSDSDFRVIRCGPYSFHAAAPRVVENFLDVTHLAFVHDGLLGDSENAELPDYQVNCGEDGIEARNILVYQPDPDGTGVGARVNYTYRVHRPLVASLEKLAEGKSFHLVLAVCPHSAAGSTSFMIIAMNHGHHIPAGELESFQDKIVAQDKPIVESQRPELLPLDLSEELHLRSDKTAVVYRKWLRDLGLSFGTE